MHQFLRKNCATNVLIADSCLYVCGSVAAVVYLEAAHHCLNGQNTLLLFEPAQCIPI
ncbi:hypothetical protein MKW98_026587 [Papaver atlanticum]|uniref:Uncharacterized protein n=1 Tax=Papaver atlanticum TaxID=357466 RepID=A0AAD4S135_9MAGN|nr:hypothetical protein MKW98_026587 [Papaver atlanticum]